MALMAGKSTKLAFSWTNPNFTGGPFKNILVLAVNGRASARADFEDQMVAVISRPGIVAVQSYSLIPRPDATPIDKKQLRDVVQGQNFDAILVSRLVKYDKKVKYVPGQIYTPYAYYGTFYGYYEEIYPVVYSPGYMEREVEAQVETNFYSTAKDDGELEWTGTSDTVNPRSLNKAIDAVVGLVVRELERGKII